MFSSLVSLLFGGEAKQLTPSDSAVGVANVQELRESFSEEECISSIGNGVEDKENSQELIDFETNEDDDWLLVSFSPGNGRQSERKMCLGGSTESEPSLESSMQERLECEDVAVEISLQVKSTVEANMPQPEEEMCVSRPAESKPPVKSIRQKRAKRKNVCEISPKVKNIVQANRPQSEKEMHLNRSTEPEPSVQSIMPKPLQCKNVNEIPPQVKSIVQVNRSQSGKETYVKKSVETISYIYGTHTGLVPGRFIHFLHEHKKYMRRVKNVSASQNEHRPIDFIPKLPSAHMRRFRQMIADHPDLIKRYELASSQPVNPCLETYFELLPKFDNRQATPPSKAEVLLKNIECIKPQQKARELDVRKYLAPSQIDRQNKVKLYEGKAKNNRRKDLWRCHSGANNNRKCC